MNTNMEEKDTMQKNSSVSEVKRGNLYVVMPKFMLVLSAYGMQH